MYLETKPEPIFGFSLVWFWNHAHP